MTHACYQEPGIVGWGPQHDVPDAVPSRGRSPEVFEQAFDDSNIFVQMKNLLVLFHVDSKFLPHLFLLDQFFNNPAVSAIHATRNQRLSLCPFICAEEKTQILNPLMNSKNLSSGNCGKSYVVYNVLLMLKGLNEILDRLSQGPLKSLQQAPETSDTSGDESDNSGAAEKFCPKKNSE